MIKVVAVSLLSLMKLQRRLGKKRRLQGHLDFSHDPTNPFSTTTVEVTPVKKKMFSIESLGAASKVISIESWLEDTLERKRKRKRRDEGAPTKDIVSLAVHSRSTLTKVKK